MSTHHVSKVFGEFAESLPVSWNGQGVQSTLSSECPGPVGSLCKHLGTIYLGDSVQDYARVRTSSSVSPLSSMKEPDTSLRRRPERAPGPRASRKTPSCFVAKLHGQSLTLIDFPFCVLLFEKKTIPARHAEAKRRREPVEHHGRRGCETVE